ncbi:hypothetical protein AL480_05160 [Stenotrophomonas maltophilia]|nr:hypothetical protein AL480_05160 [Stenotrophomonas maltophilia]
MVTLHEPGVAHGLALPATGACQQGAAGHRLQLRRLGMGDVFAVVATEADRGHAVEVAIFVAYCIKV